MTCIASWGLKTDPFAPERTAPDGSARTIRLTKTPLRPTADEAHLEFYFDLYAWKSPRVHGIGPNGRIGTFTIEDSQMITLLISGARGCGRTSLRNLLLYEIQKQAAEPPVVVDYAIALVTEERENASGLAQYLFLALTKAGVDAAPLRAMFSAMAEQTAPPPVAAMFALLKTEIRESLPDAPIVFVLDGSNSNITTDTAKTVCAMLRDIAEYVILSVTDNEDAAFLTSHFTTIQRPVAWVDSPRIDEAGMRAYLQARLAAERAGAEPDPLHPFTAEALRELFAPGSAARGGQPVSLPMKVALTKVSEAFSWKCAKWRAGEPAPFRITAADVQAYLESVS